MDQLTLTTEQIVLAERDIPEQITVSATEAIIVSGETAVTIVTGMMGPRGADGVTGSLDSILDVNVTNKQDGSLLIYSSTTNKWEATTTLSNQTLEAGQF